MRMTSSKRLLLILCVGVFFVGFIGLGAAYLSQLQEQEQLSEKLASVEKQIAGISTGAIVYQQSIDKDGIAQIEKQIAASQAPFTVPLVVSDIFQDLLAVAANTGVVITDIGSSVLTGAEIAGVPYRALSVDFAVAGSASNIYRFVDTVSRDFATGVLKSLKVDIKGDTAGESTAGSTANMRLTMYSYEGG